MIFHIPISHTETLLVDEAGPGHIFEKIRVWSGVHEAGFIVSNTWTPLHCLVCTSIYVSIALLFAPMWLLWILGISGGAMWLGQLYKLILAWKNSQKS